MRPSLQLIILFVTGLCLIVPPSRAQCSDCFVTADHGALILSADVLTSRSPDDVEKAQAGDATAVLTDEYSGGIASDTSTLHPSPTVNTPTAFGANWGHVYAGVSYQNRLRYGDWHDGIVSVGIGMGNSTRIVGLSVTAAMLDTYTEVADDWSLSLKLHRRLPFRSAIALGYENIWHTRGTDGGHSPYAVFSSVLVTRTDPTSTLGSTVVTLGMGTGRFQSETDFARRRRGVNAFGSLAVRVLRSASAVANWSGQDLNVAISLRPFSALPLTVTPALIDVTGRAGDGARLAASASVAHNLRP